MQKPQKQKGVWNKTLNNEKTLIKCLNCNYIWNTKSKLLKLTCPNCGIKTKNQKYNYTEPITTDKEKNQ